MRTPVVAFSPCVHMPRSFRILKTLGRGAFGEVHLTEIHDEDDFVQTLAVKWLHQQHSQDPEIAGRLRDEARLLGLLAHPNIVRVQGLSKLDGRLAVLMEAVEGVDLSGRHLPPQAAAEVISDAADALEAAWDTIPPGRELPLRVVHRDIKPSNIMVTPRGAVKVMDFGVARATFEAREVQTQSQQYGTARYMAPERWLEGIAEAPSDIFSLGVTLVELVTGSPVPRPRLSSQGFQEDMEDVLAALADSNGAPLVPLVRTMLAFAPTDRPDARLVIQRLAELELPGPSLRVWARTLTLDPGTPTALTGTVMQEDSDAATVTFMAPTATAVPATLAATAPVAVTVTGRAPLAVPAPPARWPLPVGFFVVSLAALGWWFSATPSAQPTPRPSPTALTAEPAPAAPTPASVAPTAEPEPTPPAPAAPVAATPEPEPAPPAPPAPTPGPAPSAVPVASPPVPTPAVPASEPTVPTTVISFIVDPGVSATTPHGRLGAGRGALRLPSNQLVRLDAQGPTGSFGCTLSIDTAAATWHVQADGRCVAR